MSPQSDKFVRWKQDFPVPSDEDSYATRREFTKFLGLTSIAFFIGTFAAAARKLWKRDSGSSTNGVAVAALDEIPEGGSKLFRYPTSEEACILVRLPDNKFAAFNQNCTHLSCPVHFDAQSSQLRCPCHHGSFSVEDGRAISGPPRRALPALTVSVRDDKVWVSS